MWYRAATAAKNRLFNMPRHDDQGKGHCTVFAKKNLAGMECRLQRVGTSPILVNSILRLQKDQNKTHVCSKVFFAQKNEFLTVQVNLKGIKQDLWIDSNDSVPVSFVHK